MRNERIDLFNPFILIIRAVNYARYSPDGRNERMDGFNPPILIIRAVNYARNSRICGMNG